MKIAVVGTGVSGLVCAHRLQSRHEVTLIEAAGRPGGHVNTIEVERSDGSSTIPVDTGFIVFNEKTYPNFLALLKELGVEWKPSDMSFSVRSERSGLEYNGTSLNSLFAQRSNLFRPSFWRMTRDILRFYKEARELLEEGEELPLGEYLERGGYSAEFVRDHLVPMGAAVWSATREGMLRFPARTLVRFFDNHGFLQVDDRPQWLVVRGGSREWVRALLAGFRGEIRLSCPVRGIQRDERGVHLNMGRDGDNCTETFDRVVLATHSDQALRILGEAALPIERELLGTFGYQANLATLHTDERLLPRRPLARAAWNYHILEDEAAADVQGATVSYWMNRLQGFEDDRQWIVSLNMKSAIDPERVEREISYDHPVFTTETSAAQLRHGEVNGADRIYFGGAYWGYGFHEDGVNSALAVCDHLERDSRRA